MSRPYLYKHLDRTLISGDTRETISLGFDSMYGGKHGDDWVTICRQDAFNVNPGEGRKYTRLFFATERVARNHANRLNRLFKGAKSLEFSYGENVLIHKS